jgi:hypothetical protein
VANMNSEMLKNMFSVLTTRSNVHTGTNGCNCLAHLLPEGK